MNDEQFDESSKSFSNKVSQTVGGTVKKTAKTAAKAIAKAAKTLIRMIMLLLKAMLPWVLIFAMIFILIAAIWDVLFEERGSSGSYITYPEEESVVVQDSNQKFTAAALTKNQAYMSAYYKYMACSSYSKTSGGSEVFTFRNTTADFAGLQDYYEKENYFYLSPNFIKMADERLNDDEFYYPEQIVMPISYELTEDGKVKQVPICDEEGALQVKSKAWNDKENPTEQTDKDVYGVWDYGLGSILKYDPYTKQKFIDCEYTSYQFDVDQINRETGSRHHVTVYTVTIPSGSDASDVMSQYDSTVAYLSEAYSDDDYSAAVEGPNRATLKQMVEEQHHINMWLQGRDITIGQRVFDSSELADFANDTQKYPIQIPLITSAATFSGNIAYTYTDYKELSELHDVGDLMGESDSETGDVSVDTGSSTSETTGTEAVADGTVNYDDPAEPINRVWVNKGTSSCGTTEFWVSRKGDVNTITPVQSGETDEPVGDQYLRDYAQAYVTYVPETVQQDYDFADRIEGDERNRELLKELGLIVPFTGVGSEGSNYNVFVISGLTADDFDVILDGTAFEGTGDAWVKLEQEYGVNAVFGMAVAWQESGFGTSDIAKNRNNAFGLLGSDGWMTFDTLSDSIYSFGRTISKNEFYINKSIDEIAVHYCTSGPVEWANAVKSLMADLYTDLMGGGVDVGAIAMNPSTNTAIGDGGEIDPEEVDIQIAQMGLTYDDLYQNVSFDVLSATNMLQQLSGEEEGGLIDWLGKVWENITDMISSFFDSMSHIFTDNNAYDGVRIKYGTPISNEDIDDIVYQTITFSTGGLYSTVYNSIDKDNLGFLFVGKEAMYGFGTMANGLTMVPGVGTTIEGFISPTDEYYQILEGWSAATGGIELSTPQGTKVLSVADNGTVTSVISNAGGSGYTVKIEYTVDGYTYGVEYRYLESVNVSTNDKVNSGDMIGLTGTKPDGTPCLFFGFTNSDGRNVDPLGYFYQPTFSNMAIVEMARSQIGNVGGAIYKSWYGLHSTDSWCAAFVSWCADQCGYINAGVFPKFASCGDGIQHYFAPNNVYWSVASQGPYIPQPGNLIFFDWEHDGVQDHVGIVEKYENGVIYTIEGNTSNSVKERTYSVYSSDIFGFAYPDYATKLQYYA